MKSKRLATLSLIIMALVSTPRAMQQLRHSLDAAQERAGLMWWELLLPEDAQAAESPAPKRSACTQLLAASVKPSARLNSSGSALRSKTAQAATQARRAQPRDLPPTVQASEAEVALNEHSAEHAGDEVAALASDAALQQHSLQEFSPAPDAWRAQMTPEALRALSSLNEQRARVVSVVGQVEDKELAGLPDADAVMAALAKKGFNVQFKLKRVMDGGQLPHPKVRPSVGRNAEEPLIISYVLGPTSPRPTE